jgi:hypothetical protein
MSDSTQTAVVPSNVVLTNEEQASLQEYQEYKEVIRAGLGTFFEAGAALAAIRAQKPFRAKLSKQAGADGFK